MLSVLGAETPAADEGKHGDKRGRHADVHSYSEDSTYLAVCAGGDARRVVGANARVAEFIESIVCVVGFCAVKASIFWRPDLKLLILSKCSRADSIPVLKQGELVTSLKVQNWSFP